MSATRQNASQRHATTEIKFGYVALGLDSEDRTEIILQLVP
jgi:hypothetical protein